MKALEFSTKPALSNEPSEGFRRTSHTRSERGKGLAEELKELGLTVEGVVEMAKQKIERHNFKGGNNVKSS